MKPRSLTGAATATVLVAAGLTVTSGTTVAHGAGYSALIQRASYGVPHITARDFASLGYGVGYAQAEGAAAPRRHRRGSPGRASPPASCGTSRSATERTAAGWSATTWSGSARRSRRPPPPTAPPST